MNIKVQEKNKEKYIDFFEKLCLDVLIFLLSSN